MYVNVKQKQTEGYRKQNSGYQKGEGKEEGQIRSMRLTDTSYNI